jgi:hypothetical protein
MKKIILIIIALVLMAAVYGLYLFNKKTESLHNIKPDFTVTAEALFNDFNKDELAALKKYEGKVLKVTGKVIMVSQSDSISNVVLKAEAALFGGVNCSFNTLEEVLKTEDAVSIKGQCQGFLTSVILNNCVLEK